MRSLRLGSVIFAAALAIAALALSACGAAKKAAGVVDPVAQASVATQRAGTAEMTFHGQFAAGAQRVPIDGHGVISTRDDARARLSFAFENKGHPVKLNEILANDEIYLGGDVLAKDLPSGKSWAKLDLRRLARQAGIDVGQLDGGGSSARRMLDYLRGAGSIHKVGRDHVVGAETTHYHAVVDVDKLARERGAADFESSLHRLKAQLTGPMTVDVWVDGRHRVRQEKVDYAASQSGQTVRATFTIQLVRFGVPLKLDVPAKDDVEDLTGRLVKQLSKRNG